MRFILGKFDFVLFLLQSKSEDKKVLLPGIEPGFFCIEYSCDNHYTTESLLLKEEILEFDIVLFSLRRKSEDAFLMYM